MSTPDTDLLLIAADSFRLHAEAAKNPADRERWYGLADRARRDWEAAYGPGDGTERVPVNQAGRVIGENHHRARLSDQDVELIRELRAAGLSLAQIAQKFEIARSTVYDIVKDRTRCHTVMGHRPARPTADPVIWPASIHEFDEVCG